MKRRDFITLLGAAAAWPLGAGAGRDDAGDRLLQRKSAADRPGLLAAFRRGLNETGFVEGKNVAFEFRWGGGEYGSLPAMAADLVRRQVAVIATSRGITTALAAKAATTTIPMSSSSAATR